jgi:hypothetical protein
MIDKIKEILDQNFAYNVENERIARELFDLYLVSKRDEVNLVVFEEYTRCYKVTDSELDKLIEDGDIEEGDIVCKALVIKNY